MSLDFYPVTTDDDSVGLFNTKVDDIYHSAFGAHTEALEKFIEPSGLVDKLKEKKQIRILDICYGMGYNSRGAISELVKNNFEGQLLIDALEIDPYVVAFSFLTKSVDFSLLEYVSCQPNDYLKIIDAAYEIIEASKFDNFLDSDNATFFKENKNNVYKYLSTYSKNANLHNIYYRYVSERNIRKLKTTSKSPKIDILMHLGDARVEVSKLEGTYDFVFLDAFTPTKLPTLWSVEFFKELFEHLAPDGNLTTYSTSAAIRNGMKESGFFVGETKYGTIAYKSEKFLQTPLDEKSQGLLDTKAGIPFYDENLNSSPSEILENRKSMVNESKKESSSQFLKKYKNKK